MLGSGSFFLGSPLMTYITKRYRNRRWQFIWTGWVIDIVSLVAASFCSSIPILALTQGVLYGVGFFILYYPVLAMLNEWFVARRGQAYGILFASTGLSGIVLPFLTETLLAKYGYKTTLRAFGAAVFATSGPAILLLRPRDADTDGGASAVADRPPRP